MPHSPGSNLLFEVLGPLLLVLEDLLARIRVHVAAFVPEVFTIVDFNLLSRIMIRFMLLRGVVSFLVGRDPSLDAVSGLLLGNLVFQILGDLWVLQQLLELRDGDVWLDVVLGRSQLLHLLHLVVLYHFRISVEAPSHLILVCGDGLEDISSLQEGLFHWKIRVPRGSSLGLFFLAQILDSLFNAVVLLFRLRRLRVGKLGRFRRFG